MIALCHDMAEAIVGDIPTGDNMPKGKAAAAAESKVRTKPL